MLASDEAALFPSPRVPREGVRAYLQPFMFGDKTLALELVGAAKCRENNSVTVCYLKEVSLSCSFKSFTEY